MKKAPTVLAMAAAMAVLSHAAPSSSLGKRSTLTLESAKQTAASAMAQVHARKAAIAVSVVDDGGHLIYAERDDGVAYGMVDASLLKARTAASFGFPAKSLEDQISQGRTSFLRLPGVLPLEGGIPSSRKV